VHLGDLERAKCEKKTVLDSRHTLRLLVGIVGDMGFDAFRHTTATGSTGPASGMARLRASRRTACPAACCPGSTSMPRAGLSV